MMWTVACFCGRCFTAPRKRCDHCGARLPEFTARPPRGAALITRLRAA